MNSISANSPTTGRVDAPSGPDQARSDVRVLQQTWWMMCLGGAAVVLTGVLAVAFPIFSSISIAIILGIVCLIAGSITLAGAWGVGQRGVLYQHLLIGSLYLLLGFLMVFAPIASNTAIAMLVGAFALVGGLLRTAASIIFKYPGWGWGLASGLLNAAFGTVILMYLPSVGLWLLGLLVGLDLIAAGTLAVVAALFVRSLSTGEVR